MIFELDDEISFPDPYLGEKDGLLAFGGDLSAERLLAAYRKGIFPFFAFKLQKQILWYCPLDRFVIFPSKIHVSHSMRTLLRKGEYTATINKDFEGVINQCSKLRIKDTYAWLSEEMVEAYRKLHAQGYAFSVEVWKGEELAGGLYGVCIGGCFFGESMFSVLPSASKVALIELARFMQKNNGQMIDCQFETPHLLSMGGEHIPYSKYCEIINASSSAGDKSLFSAIGNYAMTVKIEK